MATDSSRPCVTWAMTMVVVALTLVTLPRPVEATPSPPATHPPPARAGASPPIPGGAMVPVEWSAAAGTATSGAAHGRLVLSVGTARIVVPFASVARARQEGPRLAARLALLASTRASLREVSATTFEGGPALSWRGRIVLPLSAAQARDLGQAPAQVVSSWVAALRKAGSDPRRPSSLPREVQLPCGETRLVALPAAWLGGGVAETEDPQVASVPATSVEKPSGTRPATPGRPHDLRITGRRAGVTRVILRRGAREASIEVRVLERAGTLPARLDVYVSGGNVGTDLLVDAAEHGLEHEARVRPGAAWTAYWCGSPARLLQGTVPLTAWLEGPGLAPVARQLPVSGHPSLLRFAPAAHLAASNHPEQIEECGRLLDVPLGAGTSTWYFHHQNVPGAPPRAVQTRLENRSDRPTLLLVTACAAGPSRDELYVGHLATWRYLRRQTSGNGWQVRLLPGERYVLDERVLRPREVGCGLGLVMVAEGTPPSLVVEAMDDGLPEDAALRSAETVPAPPRPGAAIIRGRGLFADPQVSLEATYVVDGPYAFIPVGGPPYPAPLGDGTPNTGNYGVEYRLTIHIVNPTTTDRQVFLVFAAAGGAARGCLQVDDRLVETPVLSTTPGKPREFGLGAYGIPPGGTRDVAVRIIPEPGSNYPIRLIVKPLPPNR